MLLTSRKDACIKSVLFAAKKIVLIIFIGVGDKPVWVDAFYHMLHSLNFF